VTSEELLCALADDGGSLQLRPLPPRAVELLTALGAPARLAAHLRAVHDVTMQLVSWLAERYPDATVDKSSVLTAAALHDIGKVLPSRRAVRLRSLR
jgi:HD superfamily phosphodiesterase